MYFLHTGIQIIVYHKIIILFYAIRFLNGSAQTFFDRLGVFRSPPDQALP